MAEPTPEELRLIAITNNVMNYVPWSDKYCPTNLRDIIGNQRVLKQLQEWLHALIGSENKSDNKPYKTSYCNVTNQNDSIGTSKLKTKPKVHRLKYLRYFRPI